MADMRVHELAKEFGMDNKEFLARLIEMKIPVKTHSSTLNDAFVARIRKQMEPELIDRTAQAEAERIAEAERLAEEERVQKELIEAQRRQAVEEERARRQRERAEREGISVEQLEANDEARKQAERTAREAARKAALEAEALELEEFDADLGFEAATTAAIGDDTALSAASSMALADAVIDQAAPSQAGGTADVPDQTAAVPDVVLDESLVGVSEGEALLEAAESLASGIDTGQQGVLEASQETVEPPASLAGTTMNPAVLDAKGEEQARTAQVADTLSNASENNVMPPLVLLEGDLVVSSDNHLDREAKDQQGIDEARPVDALSSLINTDAKTSDASQDESQPDPSQQLLEEAMTVEDSPEESLELAYDQLQDDIVNTGSVDGIKEADVVMDAGALSQAADKQALETPAAISQNSNQNASDQAIASDTAPKAPDAQATVARQAPEPPSSTPVRFSSLLAQIEAENRRLADEAEIKAAEEAAALASRTSGRSNRNRNRNRRAKANEAAQTTEVAQASEALTANEASIAANAGQSSEIRLTISNNPNVATDSQQAVESRSSRSRKRLSDDNEDSERTRSRSRNNRRDDEGPLVISPIPLDYADYDDQLDKDEEDRYRKMAQAAEQFQRERVLAEARAAVEAASNEGEGRRRKRKERREAEAREKIELEAIEKGIDVELLSDDVIQVTTGVTVGELAEIMKVPANDIIKRLFMLGMMMTVTQTMSDDLVELIADDMERKVRIVSPEEEYAVSIVDMPADLQDRPPVITVMGHVDHGKTSLLDAIRSTGVVATEAGGITQHIGASVVNIKGRQITFIDTPGHEAFTAMRARGAKVTDVVVLVVAADDGVMPQTIEAISHANAAEVPIVVAINKIDRPDANLDRVRAELAEHGIISEEWGGQNLFVEVSAKEHIGIDDLLETILLQADYLELKANPKAIASGFVIEAKLDRGRGPVATVLVQRGTLHVGEMLVAGTAYGRVRALISPQGDNVSEAYPADPVEVLGLGSVPEAGDEFRVFTDERDARNLAEDRALRKRLISQQEESHITLEDLFARMEGGLSELNLVVKADVQGSIEALKDALDKMDQSEVNINVIHSAVGGITETDVTLATASDAIIIGFNVRPESKARLAAEREKVEIKTYRVIYQAIDDINAARIGMLKPDLVEEHTGLAEVREVYRVPRVGNIAGCFVDSGEINADDQVRVVRNGAIVFESKIASLRHYRDDVDIVRSGLECGIGIEDFQDIKVGDVIEGYRIREVARES